MTASSVVMPISSLAVPVASLTANVDGSSSNAAPVAHPHKLNQANQPSAAPTNHPPADHQPAVHHKPEVEAKSPEHAEPLAEKAPTTAQSSTTTQPSSPTSNAATSASSPSTPQTATAPVKASPPPAAAAQSRTAPTPFTAAGDGTGEVVGEYVLGETIGKGTFGKVKLGLHLVTGEKVAVKLLEKKRIVQLADVERVAREIKILKRCRHANVIQLFEVIDTPERILLVMEHIDGGEMFEYIVAHHRIREPEAAQLFQQIVDGLAYLHANEVTHRDLKPENLLLQSVAADAAGAAGFTVKIVDFGLSNTHDGGRLLRTACGSPCYAAPEMIEGKQYKGPMADVWSLGVVLFAMVCGFLPFEDSNTNLLYKKILSADYKLPAFLSPAAQDLIRRIFVTDPEKRFTLSEIRKHAWVTGRTGLTPRPVVTMASSPALPLTARDIVRDRDATTLHELALQQLEALGFGPAAVNSALQQNLHNSLTASYFLFANKLKRVLRDRPSQPQIQRGQSCRHSSVSAASTEAAPVPVVSPRRTSESPSRRPQPTIEAAKPHVPSQNQQAQAMSAPQRPGSVRGGRHLVVVHHQPPGQVTPLMARPPSMRGDHFSPTQVTPPMVRPPSMRGDHFTPVLPSASSATPHGRPPTVTLRPLMNAPRPEMPRSQRRVGDGGELVSKLEAPSVQNTVVTSSGSTVIRRRPQAPSHRPSGSASYRPPTPSSSSSNAPATTPRGKEDDTRAPQKSEPSNLQSPPQRIPQPPPPRG